jgi:hypothetical protein
MRSLRDSLAIWRRTVAASSQVDSSRRGWFAKQEVDSDSPSGAIAASRIQQLQQQIEAWQALLEKLAGNE